MSQTRLFKQRIAFCRVMLGRMDRPPLYLGRHTMSQPNPREGIHTCDPFIAEQIPSSPINQSGVYLCVGTIRATCNPTLGSPKSRKHQRRECATNLRWTMDVVTKARAIGLYLITLPSHTSHALQPLEVICFKSFKATLCACRDL